MTKAVKFQALNTFKPYAVFYRTGGQIEKFHFINGWGASVANHDGSYAVSYTHLTLPTKA